MHSPIIHPHQVTRSLNESIDRNIIVIEVFQHRPPGAFQEVDIISAVEIILAKKVKCIIHYR